MKRRNLILLLGGASSGAMSVGTGAFSSMEAERGVSVDVVDDDKAFVGYETPNDAPVSNGDEITLVRVENRFNHDVSIVDVNVEERADVLGEISFYQDEKKIKEDVPIIGSGGDVEIKAPVNWNQSDEEADIEITITVEGSGVTAKLFGDMETREFTIERENEADDDSDDNDDDSDD